MRQVILKRFHENPELIDLDPEGILDIPIEDFPSFNTKIKPKSNPDSIEIVKKHRKLGKRKKYK